MLMKYEYIGFNGISFSAVNNHFWLRGGPLDRSFMLAYFMSHDVLPPNGAQMLV